MVKHKNIYKKRNRVCNTDEELWYDFGAYSNNQLREEKGRSK